MKHDDLIAAGAPALDDGLQYEVRTFQPDEWPQRTCVEVRIVRTGLTFWQRLISGRTLIRVSDYLKDLMDPEDETVLPRGLVGLCENAERAYQADKAMHAAIQLIRS